MRTILISSILLGFMLVSTKVSYAAAIVVPNEQAHGNVRMLSLKIKDIEKITGHKLSLRQKIELSIFKFTFRKKIRTQSLHEGKSDKGQLAMILGIIGLGSLLIPYLAILALPCAIAALIIGYSARRKDPSNKKARTGIVLGWVTIGIFVLALIIVVALLTTSFAWY
ncbi:MAG TPA: hypothetical protein VK588_00950 [Chitinophagaceae bacterium]|nr:hypothetical protein [Chitinophagaceae bacterium]